MDIRFQRITKNKYVFNAFGPSYTTHWVESLVELNPVKRTLKYKANESQDKRQLVEFPFYQILYIRLPVDPNDNTKTYNINTQLPHTVGMKQKFNFILGGRTDPITSLTDTISPFRYPHIGPNNMAVCQYFQIKETLSINDTIAKFINDFWTSSNRFYMKDCFGACREKINFPDKMELKQNIKVPLINCFVEPELIKSEYETI